VRRAWFLGLVGTCGALALGLAGAEILVRLAVGTPPPVEPLDAGLPPLHEPDPELGWRNKAGRVVWPGRERDRGRPITMTFWPDGLRATAPAHGPERPEVVVVGCSYTQGWAVSDADTWPWRLQERLPDFRVANLGTAGYGTHQSLLALERLFAKESAPVALVVYGFIEHHEVRNVAPAGWLHTLATATAAGRLAVPYATLGSDGDLERHPPESYPRWALDRRLAAVALLGVHYARWNARGRLGQARAVTEALLGRLRDASAARGARLLVAILEARSEARRHYRRWVEAHGIDTVDCSDSRSLEPAYLVPGYGHPGREVQAGWAECVARRLGEDRLGGVPALNGRSGAPRRSP
jgi:hypothetical protein